MKTQTTGLVLCALLLSTFGHDVLNRYQTQRCAQRLTLSTSQNSTGVSAKHNDSTSSNLELIINSTTNLVAVVNVTAAVAIVFDISHSHVAIFCGFTGNVIVINLETRIGAFLSGNSSHHGWLARSISFEAYFKSVTSLEPLYKTCYTNGEKFTVRNVSPKISHEFKLVRTAISRGEFYVTQANALELFIRYSEIFVETLKGPLSGLLKIIGSGVRSLETSLRSLTAGLQIFSETFSIIKGGVTVLADLHLDWNLVLNSQSWLQMLTYFFSKLKEHNVDVKSIARHYADNFPHLLTGLAGNSTQGTNGPMRIFAEVRTIIKGKSTPDSLADVLLEYFSHSRDNTATFKDFKKELQCFADFVVNIGIDNELPLPMAFAYGVEKDYILDNGVDVYKMTLILFDRNTLPLRNIVNVLPLVQKYVSIENSIGFLLYRLISLVAESSVDVIRSLIPGIEIPSANFLAYVFDGAKVSDVKGNLYEFLKCRPVIREILRLIDSSLESCNNVSLKEIFASPHFRKCRCVITKMLAKVIKNIEEGGHDSADAGHHYESLGAKNKQHK